MRFGMTVTLLSMLLLPASFAEAAVVKIYATNFGDGELLSFDMVNGGTPVQTGTITGLGNSNKMAISPGGELFLSNGGADTIHRYLGVASTLTPNPTYPNIPDSNAGDGFNFNNPNGVGFRNGELFSVNINSNQILRFNFDGSGAPLANLPATSITGISSTRGRDVAFSPSGDRMYVTGCCSSSGVLNVYSVDGSGVTSLLNTLTTTNFSASGITINNLQGMTVSSTGELWLADTGSVDADGEIVRVILDGSGNISTASTAIPGSHANLFRPQNLFFSDDGELFVSNIGVSATSDDGFLSRFTFDGGGSISSSSIFGPAGDFGSIVLFSVPPVPVPEPSSFLLLGLGACFCLRKGRRQR